jgi:hypothetical protein
MKYIKTALVASTLLISTASNAATVSTCGTDLCFEYDDATLFGTGNVVGNNIFFSPTNFRAESNNTEGLVQVSATLNITATLQDPNSGFVMDMFNLIEKGDYQMIGGTSTSVTAGGSFSVTSLTIGGMNQMNTFNDTGLNTVGPVTLWDASSSIDLSSINGWGSDTEVIIQLQNDLSATSNLQGEGAFIQKKYGDIGVIVNPVPVPAAVWLFGSGLIGLAGVARRKKA